MSDDERKRDAEIAIMKIHDHGGPGAPNRPGEAPGVDRPGARGQGGRTPTASDTDKVSVSEEARTLSRLRNEVDADAVRSEKVQDLRGKIERGEYQPDLRSVARKFLASIFGGRSD
jgi:flagellar biosynthesis anti-sigma factor FlgM